MKKVFLFLFLIASESAFSQTAGTYTLKQCVDVALDKNITLKQTLLQVESNKVAVDQIRMSRYPSLNAGASQAYNFGRSVNPYDNSVVANQQVNSNNFSLSSSFVIFQGLQTQYTIQQRLLNLNASGADVESTKNNIALGVVEAFANVLTAKALLASAQSQLQSTNAQIERTTKLVDAGKLPNTNLLDLKGQAASDETNIVVAENQLDLAKVTLALWMQIDPTLIKDVEEPSIIINESEYKPASEVYAIAEPAQPQIKAAKIRVLSADKGIALAKSSYYPSLNFQAGLFTNYSSLAQRYIPGSALTSPIYGPKTELLVTDNLGNSVPITVQQASYTGPGSFEELTFKNQFDNNLRKGFSFNLNIPLFNGLQARYATKNAKINMQNAQLELEKQKNTLRQNIETSTSNERAARLRYQAVEKQIAALEEVYRSAETRFNLGVLNSVDYIVIKNNLVRAQNDKARYKYDFFIRRAVLDYYLGKDLNFY